MDDRNFQKMLINALSALMATAYLYVVAYPEKPPRITEPWAPSSAGDAPMRILAELAKEKFGQPIVVQNLQGGTAQLEALKAKPDGYTTLNARSHLDLFHQKRLI